MRVLVSLVERLRSASRRFLLATQVAIGILCGVCAYCFHRLVEILRAALIEPALGQHGIVRVALVIGVPAVTALLIAVVIRRFAPGTGGANMARVRRAYVQDPGLLDKRSIAATFFLTPISLGSGAPLGPEGPIVVIASGLSAGVAKALKLPRKVVRGMIPVGTAAGIAAIFNAPITGVVYALEEVLGTAEKGVLGGAIVAAVAAAVVERFLLGGRPVLGAPPATWKNARELIGFAILGIAAGVTAGTAIQGIRRLRKRLEGWIPNIAWRGAAAGALIGVLGLFSPQILGVGYGAAANWLNGGGTAREAALAFAAKTSGFIVALSSGIIGGTFAPSLFMGAALGSSVGHVMAHLFPGTAIEPRAYALVGMGALFAGILRCPIAAILIVVEVTGDYGLILPLMLAVSLGIAISRLISRENMIERQLREEGFLGAEGRLDPLADLKVEDVMTHEVIAVPAEMSVLDVVRAVGGTRHHFYPVVDAAHVLVGVVDADSIDEAARTGNVDLRISDLARVPKIVATENSLVQDLVATMARENVNRAPVVAADGSGRLVGFVSPPDLLRARMRNLESSATPDRS